MSNPGQYIWNTMRDPRTRRHISIYICKIYLCIYIYIYVYMCMYIYLSAIKVHVHTCVSPSLRHTSHLFTRARVHVFVHKCLHAHCTNVNSSCIPYNNITTLKSPWTYSPATQQYLKVSRNVTNCTLYFIKPYLLLSWLYLQVQKSHRTH